MEAQEINSTGMLVEVINLESEDEVAAAAEGGYGEFNDGQSALMYLKDAIQSSVYPPALNHDTDD